VDICDHVFCGTARCLVLSNEKEKMISVTPYTLPEVVNREELREWRKSLRHKKYEAPAEVCSFITAISDKLADFGCIRNYSVAITGRELKLSGMKEYQGEYIHEDFAYELKVPHMVATDHHLTMHRLYERKGKQGLIDFCKAKVKGTELAKVLEILNVHVFNQERPEFVKVMNDIKAANKIDNGQ